MPLLYTQNELREEVIENVKWNVNRDSPEDKLRDFLEWMSAVKRDTLHHVRLELLLSYVYLTGGMLDSCS